MSFKNVSLISFAVASLLVTSGCAKKASSTGGSGGSGPTPTINCANPDYSDLANTDPVSFTNDVMPIFGLSCTASDCHNYYDASRDATGAIVAGTTPGFRAGLPLSPKCAVTGSGATLECAFPATAPDPDPNASNPMVSQPQPLGNAILGDVYSQLMAASTTAPAVMRVVAGHPESSFLIDKLAGTQNTKNYVCMNQDSSHEPQPPLPCGVGMPQDTAGVAFMCESTPDDFSIIARWVAQGAKAN
ncbi:MAG TPA: hypothetical protein VH142_24675 [Polyangiaceae bacterium]|jgi:hypothetical protein|nr:hypothetical protein [Polyangiaceae bacterium]